MSKELEALERLVDDVLDIRHYYKQFSSSTPIIMQDKQLIENALNKLIELEDTLIDVKNGSLVIVDVEKMKALEIIKEKRVNIDTLDAWNWDIQKYNERRFEEQKLTQEEYDLLKEVLL